MDLGCFHKYIAFYAYINCCKTNSSLYGAIKSEFERGLNMNKEWSELNKTMQAQIKRKILIRGVLILYLLYEVS